MVAQDAVVAMIRARHIAVILIAFVLNVSIAICYGSCRDQQDCGKRCSDGAVERVTVTSCFCRMPDQSVLEVQRDLPMEMQE